MIVMSVISPPGRIIESLIELGDIFNPSAICCLLGIFFSLFFANKITNSENFPPLLDDEDDDDDDDDEEDVIVIVLVDDDDDDCCCCCCPEGSEIRADDCAG